MWKLYPLLAHVPMRHVSVGIGPFYVLYGYAKLRFSQWLISQKVLAVLAIMALSFAAFVLPAIEYAIRLLNIFRRRGPRFLLVFLRMRTFDLFVLLMFFGGHVERALAVSSLLTCRARQFSLGRRMRLSPGAFPPSCC